MSGNIINSKQPFVNFYRKGQIITKEMLNDQFIRSVLFDLSKKSRFISGVNYLSYGYHGISILGQDNYTITYNETD
jgi:hypothetical protein